MTYNKLPQHIPFKSCGPQSHPVRAPEFLLTSQEFRHSLNSVTRITTFSIHALKSYRAGAGFFWITLYTVQNVQYIVTECHLIDSMDWVV